MATLSLTDEQVVQLVKQLAPQSKQRVLADLTAERDQWWQTAARDGEKDMRRLAEARGLDWDAIIAIPGTLKVIAADPDDDAVLECAGRKENRR
jgi:hypothetical protein